MRVFLTGGRGMVGQALLRCLSPSHELVAPSRAELDLEDKDAVVETLRDARPECVIHAAGKVGGIQANIDDPVGFLVHNLLATANVIEAARRLGVERFVFLGSSCMYPKGLYRPIREEDLLTGPLEPTNEGYALSKIVGTRLCCYVAEEGLPWITLVPCNLFGPHDHFDARRSHLLAAIILKVHEAMGSGDQDVEVWGDGTARREFLYVDDLAACVGFLLERLGSVDLPPVLNAGYGRDYTVLEYYRMVAKRVGYEGSFRTDPSRPTGMPRKLLDSSRLYSLGWRPSVDVLDGIDRTYRYYLESVGSGGA